MRLVFAGTPEAAVPALRLLAESPHEVVLVVTRPDAPTGRKRVLTPSPVATAAAALGLPVWKTAQLDEATTEAIVATRPDLGVIVAYGGLVREPLLSAPVHGWINLHFSLLPRWRGAAPVQRALIAGDEVTGACVFRLVAALDAGDVYASVEYRVPSAATAADVLDALAYRGGYLLSGVVNGIAAGTAVATPQTGEVTFAHKLTIEDARLLWDEPADTVLARVRGVTPEPGAFTTVGGQRLKVLVARPAATGVRAEPGVIGMHGGDLIVGTATEPVALDLVQPEGKGPMVAADWWRGLRVEDARAGS